MPITFILFFRFLTFSFFSNTILLLLLFLISFLLLSSFSLKIEWPQHMCIMFNKNWSINFILGSNHILPIGGNVLLVNREIDYIQFQSVLDIGKELRVSKFTWSTIRFLLFHVGSVSGKLAWFYLLSLTQWPLFFKSHSWLSHFVSCSSWRGEKKWEVCDGKLSWATWESLFRMVNEASHT